MTKVQLRYELTRPLDERLMTQLSNVNGVYGIERVSLARTLDGLLVEYDASRLNPLEVDSVLRSAGLPVQRVSPIAPPPPPANPV